MSALYGIAKSTAVAIVHEGVIVLLKHLVPVSIKFPIGDELEQVMCDYGSIQWIAHVCRCN